MRKIIFDFCISMNTANGKSLNNQRLKSDAQFKSSLTEKRKNKYFKLKSMYYDYTGYNSQNLFKRRMSKILEPEILKIEK